MCVAEKSIIVIYALVQKVSVMCVAEKYNCRHTCK